MRLTSAETNAIRACAKQVFGLDCTVRLFGSRADEGRQGGDIDLHVVAESPDLATVHNEILFSLALQNAIGEQRVDVIVRPPGFPSRPIDEIAILTGTVIA